MRNRITLGVLLLLAFAAFGPGCDAPQPIATNSARPVNTNGSSNANANTNSNANSNAAIRAGASKLLDDYIKSLPLGEVAFNTPPKMRLGETINIQAKLGGPEMRGNLKGTITGPGPVETQDVKVAGVMEARLVGVGFQIAPVTPTEQAVSESGATAWEWQVKAVEEGRQQLLLTLNVVAQLEGRERKHSTTTFSREIAVEVSAGSRFGKIAYDNLGLIVTVIVLPFIGAVAVRVRKHLRRRRGADGPPEEK